MADETDTTSEVARVLNLHASFKASEEIQDPNTPWYWECDGCDTRLVLSGTYGRPEVIAALAAHQAAMLAEAGLLRDHATIDALNERCRILVDEGDHLRARIAAQEPAGGTRGGFGDSRASGGLGERLRALGTGQTRSLRRELRAMADEVDVLEAKRARQAQTIGELQGVRERLTGQVEAIRAAITREAAHGEAITRCNLVAERFQTVLDSVTAP